MAVLGLDPRINPAISIGCLLTGIASFAKWSPIEMAGPPYPVMAGLDPAIRSATSLRQMADWQAVTNGSQLMRSAITITALAVGALHAPLTPSWSSLTRPSHRMFADWDCIFRKLYAGGDGRDKPVHDRVGESIISAVGVSSLASSHTRIG